MHPLEWLPRINYRPGHDRLACRLLALGVPPELVDAARNEVDMHGA